MADKLSAYRKKRRFSSTPEPKGGSKRSSARRPRFVVHKHDASNLHYDVRLEVEGVLKSFAVPKGPSLNPKEKRLAIPTEDHPLEYRTFEGVIPEDEYGGGTVMVWDRGTYRNLKNDDDDKKKKPMKRCFKDGHVTVRLNGKKLKGGFSLIRTGKGKRPRWMLVKIDDDEADARRKITKSEPKSVKSGRTINQIARKAKHGKSSAARSKT